MHVSHLEASALATAVTMSTHCSGLGSVDVAVDMLREAFKDLNQAWTWHGLASAVAGCGLVLEPHGKLCMCPALSLPAAACQQVLLLKLRTVTQGVSGP